MLSDFLASLQFVGAIVGLLTGVFVVWERIARGRPLAYIHSSERAGGHFVYLHVENRAETPLLVSIFDGSREKFFSIATDHSAEALMAYLLPGVTTIVLAPKVASDFPLV